ncbi:hypothetical protein Bbelb_289880 [Branchiostoma belcheri]|nr:hypothetical protein Bbelb_289880 [Branchiostoma belcheri]
MAGEGGGETPAEDDFYFGQYRPKAEGDPTRGRAGTEGDAEYTRHTRLGQNAFESSFYVTFDNVFRTSPYREVRTGPESFIEHYRGPDSALIQSYSFLKQKLRHSELPCGHLALQNINDNMASRTSRLIDPRAWTREQVNEWIISQGCHSMDLHIEGDELCRKPRKWFRDNFRGMGLRLRDDLQRRRDAIANERGGPDRLWSVAETECLISIWAETQIQNKLESARNREPYNMIMVKMRDHGYERSSKQIQNKIPTGYSACNAAWIPARDDRYFCQNLLSAQ